RRFKSSPLRSMPSRIRSGDRSAGPRLKTVSTGRTPATVTTRGDSMTRLLALAGLVAALLLVGGAASLPAASSETTDGTLTSLEQPRPSWLTPALEDQIVAAGAKGVEVPLTAAQALEVNCLGTAPPYVGADGVSATAVAAG